MTILFGFSRQSFKRERGRKFSTFWTGPWRVIRKISNVLFEIRTEGNWNDKVISLVVSHDRIKHYVGTVINDKEPKQLEKGDFSPEDKDSTINTPGSKSDKPQPVSGSANSYLQAPRIWPDQTRKTDVDSALTQTNLMPHRNTESANDTDFSNVINPVENTPTESLEPKPNLHDEAETISESFDSRTPTLQHATNHSTASPHPGNFRKSLRVQGLQPQYLGVDNKDKPKLNPFYE